MNIIEDLINKTGKRKDAFALMIDKIKNKKEPIIVETGCSRYSNNFDGDGSLHHIMELVSIWPSCRSGTIIAIDDNFLDGTGKGRYVNEWMEKNNINPIFKDYQIIWEIL